MAFCDAVGVETAPCVVGWQGCVKDNVAYRHNGKAQAVYLDGHVGLFGPGDVPTGEDAWQHPFWGNVPQFWQPR